MTHPNLIRHVAHVLKAKAKKGTTTKRDAAALVWRRVESLGGPTSIGIGRAAVTMACLHLIEAEINRQFKSGLTEHLQKFKLSINPSCPIEIRESLHKIPSWIATSEGDGAIWVPSLQATPDNWLANAILKQKKAMQTERKAAVSLEIGQYLQRYKFGSLSDAFV